jgi:hypothetical protein
MAGSQASFSMSRELFGFFRSEELIKVRPEKITPRDAGHFLEISVDEDDLRAIVRNDDAFVQRFENAFDLFQPFRLLDVHGAPLARCMLPKHDKTTNAHTVTLPT